MTLLTPEDLTKIRRSNRKRPKTPRPYWKAAQPITPGRKGIRIERIIDELEETRSRSRSHVEGVGGL